MSKDDDGPLPRPTLLPAVLGGRHVDSSSSSLPAVLGGHHVDSSSSSLPAVLGGHHSASSSSSLPAVLGGAHSVSLSSVVEPPVQLNVTHGVVQASVAADQVIPETPRPQNRRANQQTCGHTRNQSGAHESEQPGQQQTWPEPSGPNTQPDQQHPDPNNRRGQTMPQTKHPVRTHRPANTRSMETRPG